MKDFFTKTLCFVMGLALAGSSFGVATTYRKQNLKFVTSPLVLKDSISLPVSDHVETLLLPPKNIAYRVKKSQKDERVEPIQVSVMADDASLTALARELAYNGKETEVKTLLLEKMKKYNKDNRPRAKVEMVKDDFKIIDIKALAKHLGKTHHQLTVGTGELYRNRELRREFLSQLKGFLPRDQRKEVFDRIKAHKDLIVERDLLPEFARRMIKKYTVYRGPNCFHASLAFHGQSLTNSPYINVKEEKGYHRAMINYDELWRAIDKNFYEIDPTETPLKYGDMIVFFNLPEEPVTAINFRWIRHAATYLFDGYTFSKGSKSPDTPYTIKTIAEEWKTWLSYTKNLGVKIYRRNSKQLKANSSPDLNDWIY